MLVDGMERKDDGKQRINGVFECLEEGKREEDCKRFKSDRIKRERRSKEKEE